MTRKHAVEGMVRPVPDIDGLPVTGNCGGVTVARLYFRFDPNYFDGGSAVEESKVAGQAAWPQVRSWCQ
ncbi:hypothetical protein [Amycolatopsis sp. cmx-4-68]|uniref:hypothetical protein n=1 Tax=Amycolatopsis sp. cmx-4-68 TaxID=2790938 RepID=UPI00397B5067